ncbi:14534_t:CDS:2 [Funneliformis caledonium]|uniref:14534_t:CDS:1 n=1 Tax=Funneliformis caledonium TaxID=1117310 RepID=A0A9N9BSE5_9GLOM|nr:14534_t:CDS:2 [Funneliformis caledonium]
MTKSALELMVAVINLLVNDAFTWQKCIKQQYQLDEIKKELHVQNISFDKNANTNIKTNVDGHEIIFVFDILINTFLP